MCAQTISVCTDDRRHTHTQSHTPKQTLTHTQTLKHTQQRIGWKEIICHWIWRARRPRVSGERWSMSKDVPGYQQTFEIFIYQDTLQTRQRIHSRPVLIIFYTRQTFNMFMASVYIPRWPMSGPIINLCLYLKLTLLLLCRLLLYNDYCTALKLIIITSKSLSWIY